MQKLKFFIITLMIFPVKATVAQTTTAVDHFDKVIISPHIEVTFVEGSEESGRCERRCDDG